MTRPLVENGHEYLDKQQKQHSKNFNIGPSDYQTSPLVLMLKEQNLKFDILGPMNMVTDEPYLL